MVQLFNETLRSMPYNLYILAVNLFKLKTCSSTESIIINSNLGKDHTFQ